VIKRDHPVIAVSGGRSESARRLHETESETRSPEQACESLIWTAGSAIYYRTCWHLSRVEERSLKIITLAAVALFVVGAIAEAQDTHTVWGQGSTFWMLLGFAAVALEFAAPTYAARLHRR
jgi:hypothetical protein